VPMLLQLGRHYANHDVRRQRGSVHAFLHGAGSLPI